MTTQDNEHRDPASFWKPINFGWKYWNYAIIAVGVIVGFWVWFVPDKRAEPEIAAQLAQRVKEEKAYKAWKVEQDRIAREQEELGLVYIEPGTNPFLPPPSQREGAKPEGKP